MTNTLDHLVIPKWDDNNHKPKSDKTLIAWVVGILVVGIVAIAIVLAVSHHSAPQQSPSYQAGYAAGPQWGGPNSPTGEAGAIGNASGVEQVGCNVGWTITEETESYNENQWLLGCGAGAAHAWGNNGN